MSDFIKMDYFEWLEKFEPMQNKIEGADMIGANEYGVRFETYGKEYDCVLFMLAFFPYHVWTELDCDGELIIGNGWHFINRFAYYITDKPALNNTDYEITDED